MTVYSFYIFDRHTECVYHRSWITPIATALPPSSTTSRSSTPVPTSKTVATTTTVSSAGSKPGGTKAPPTGPAAKSAAAAAAAAAAATKDNAKLVFGTVFSLRNMVRKLGGEDDAFVCFRTQDYKLHFYETPTNLRLVLLTDTGTMSMRNVLHQIYINLWVEYVVKNPLSPVEHKGGEGVKNELFELGLDQFVRSLG